MKTNLTHLPPEKQRQLEAVVAILREAVPVEMILLFGSHARGDWVEDPVTGYRSDFDLLVVVKKEKLAEKHELWAEVERKVEALPGMTPVNIIVHDIKHVKDQLARVQYFFSDIAKEGIVLHDSGHFSLASTTQPTLAERRRQAEGDFEEWSSSADYFFDDFEANLQKHRYKQAAFYLHQATERYYAATLLVFTAYKPRIHDIRKLARQAENAAPELRGIFPVGTPEDERLFQLLRRAYIEARYSRKYRITADELHVLRERVRRLREAVERVCKARIVGLA
jgi:uncharacterized protein